MSRRFVIPLVIVGSLLAMLASCYGDALFRGKQFAYRDAAHFYYPLYQLVEREWNEHRWPLWETEENGGMPLLGNPTAAVLYPGKIIYRLFPYELGARLYVVAHTILAFVGMAALSRSWGISWTGSTLSALAYAFGAPVLFQYCNIIYLVGAAWTPLGFRAVDRWLRLGRRWALLELAVILAMQTLGGDPESSYIIGMCAGGYAIGLSFLRKQENGAKPRRLLPIVAGALVVMAIWVVATIALGEWLPQFRPRHKVPLPLPWMTWAPTVVLGVWGLVGLGLLVHWIRTGRKHLLVPMLAGLCGAAALSGSLGAAQLLPVFEFTGQSGRAVGGSPHDIYPFSLEPLRVVEFVWPNLFGTHFEGNRSWLDAVPPRKLHAKIWIPSLYLGGLTTLLALGTLGFRNGPPWRAWLTAITFFSLIAGLGEYTSPLWWARWSPSMEARLGPHDPMHVTALRQDRLLRDGDGSAYWFLATALPGFRQFRFPSKLVGFTAFALAGLAGIGWDELVQGMRRKRNQILAGSVFGVSLIALIGSMVYQSSILAMMRSAVGQSASPFGPFDTVGAYSELRWAFAQATVVALVALVLSLKGRRAPLAAGIVAIITMTADLALANSRYVFTVDQTAMDVKPKVVELLEAAEREKPADGPYRVHRMPLWNPTIWFSEKSPDRVKDFVEWERTTIQPKYGLPYNIHYTWTLGVAELWDFDWFFGGFPRQIDAGTAKMLSAQPNQKVIYYPRRSFDLWNTRYFIVPAFPNGWNDEDRGFAAFLPNSELIYPPPSFFNPRDEKKEREWMEQEDFRIYRNKAALPRAWVVHQGRYTKPITRMDRSDREQPMEEILYQNDPFWNDPNLRAYDPAILAWVDEDKANVLAPYLRGSAPGAGEKVTITQYSPQRVEIETELERPGFVVLADIYYPGWRLTINGKETPIYRANRMMRGATVKAGKSKLVYTYDPDSFRTGGKISLAALGALVLLGVAFTRWPVATRFVE